MTHLSFEHIKIDITHKVLSFLLMVILVKFSVDELRAKKSQIAPVATYSTTVKIRKCNKLTKGSDLVNKLEWSHISGKSILLGVFPHV